MSCASKDGERKGTEGKGERMHIKYRLIDPTRARALD